VHAAAVAARADAVLHGLDLHVVPVLQERAENAAVMAHVAVKVRRPFPDADGGEVLGIEARDLPLVHGVIGNAVESDLAVRPRLLAAPFDALGEILRLARRPQFDVAGRAAAAARIDAHAGVAVRHPFLRVDHLPVLIFVGRPVGYVGVVFHHAPPRGLVAVLEMEPLAVGAVGHDHRVFAALDRPEDVGTQHDAVLHRDRHVPVDLHPVADFAHFAIGHGCLPPCGTYPSPAGGGWTRA